MASGHFNPLCEGSENAWCARKLLAVPKALRLRDAVLFTHMTASWRRAGLAFAIPVSFTAGEKLWWSQRASWMHPEDPLTKEGLRGMAVCSPLAAGALGCQGLCQRNS